jgi:hypothetical protein
MPQSAQSIYRSRIRRWSREIAAAVLLTLAAVTFIAVALLRESAPPGQRPMAASDQVQRK